MSKGLKMAIAVLVTAAVITGWYLGAYLPLRKSQNYIAAWKALPKVKSFQEFESIFDSVLDFYSPVGQDEIVSAYLGIILDALSRKPGPPPEVVKALIRDAEKRGRPIIDSGRGFLLSQNILKLAAIYKSGAINLRDETYYQKSAELFNLGLEYSPRRAVFLYNLFDLYVNFGKRDEAVRTGKVILQYWPDDKEVKRVVGELESQSSKQPGE